MLIMRVRRTTSDDDEGERRRKHRTTGEIRVRGIYDEVFELITIDTQFTSLLSSSASRSVAGRLKMREWKMREQIAGVENAGVD